MTQNFKVMDKADSTSFCDLALKFGKINENVVTLLDISDEIRNEINLN